LIEKNAQNCLQRLNIGSVTQEPNQNQDRQVHTWRGDNSQRGIQWAEALERPDKVGHIVNGWKLTFSVQVYP